MRDCIFQSEQQHPTPCKLRGKSSRQVEPPSALATNGTTTSLLSHQWNIISQRQGSPSLCNGSMGLFQGDLSPLSGRSMVHTCILPILLYGAENWCLSQNSIQVLDSFLGELSKRLLKLPQWYSNTPACIAAGQRSARALCLTRKLNFLQKILAKDTNEAVSAQTLASLSDDINSTCLVRECIYIGTWSITLEQI